MDSHNAHTYWLLETEDQCDGFAELTEKKRSKPHFGSRGHVLTPRACSSSSYPDAPETSASVKISLAWSYHDHNPILRGPSAKMLLLCVTEGQKGFRRDFVVIIYPCFQVKTLMESSNTYKIFCFYLRTYLTVCYQKITSHESRHSGCQHSHTHRS